MFDENKFLTNCLTVAFDNFFALEDFLLFSISLVPGITNLRLRNCLEFLNRVYWGNLLQQATCELIPADHEHNTVIHLYFGSVQFSVK